MHGLYAITPTFEQCASDSWLMAQTRALLAGGVRYIQLRDKSCDQPRRLKVAKALRALCADHDARLLINDDWALALASGAHGVHLGQGDGSPADARDVLGSHALIGRTCHDSEQLAADAVAQGASYLAFGRFYPSRTKPHARPAAPALLTRAKARFSQPLVAIGGVNLDNAQPLIRAGADALALCQGLYGSSEPESVARAFTLLFSVTHKQDTP